MLNKSKIKGFKNLDTSFLKFKISEDKLNLTNPIHSSIER